MYNINSVTIQPHVRPRGPIDTAVGLVVAVVQLCALIGLALAPSYAVKILTHNSLAVVLTYLMTFMLNSFLMSLFVVQHLRCDEEGLEFVRAFGNRKKIPWTAVESIEEASRAEVVLCGWLWPRFPPREFTASWTSVGHYRIRWQGGTAYFPPKDVQRFLYAMQMGLGTSGTSRW